MSKVLYVEDYPNYDFLIAEAFEEEIETGKYEVILATSGEEALKKIEEDKQHEIELIVTDLKMPAAKIDGWKLIEILNQRHSHLKIIVVSAFGNWEQFTAELRNDVLFILDRSKWTLNQIKPFIEAALENPPPQSKYRYTRPRFDSVWQEVKELPSKHKAELVRRTVNLLHPLHLTQLKEEIPELIDAALDRVLEREKLREWLIDKQDKGLIDSGVPLRELDYFYINVRKEGPYYAIRWWDEGTLKTKYIPKKIGLSIPPHLLQHNQKNIMSVERKATKS